MIYPYGFCECSTGKPEAIETVFDKLGTMLVGTKSTSHCCIGTGPASYTAIRDGKEIKLCSKCTLSKDRPNLKLLVQTEDDLTPFIEFDELGVFVITGKLGEQSETEMEAG